MKAVINGRYLQQMLILFGLFIVALYGNDAEAKRLALLVGVGDYQAEQINDLEGPPYDVAAFRKLLVQRWGFDDQNIQILVDQAATKKAILAALASLASNSRAGDVLFFYFSGHGTSRYDSAMKNSLPLPHHSGAIIPYDAVAQGSAAEIVDHLIVGRTDLQPLLKRLDQGGRKVFVAFDSCFSGNATRGLFSSLLSQQRLPSRFASFHPRSGLAEDEEDDDEMMLLDPDTGKRPEPPPYPYQHIYFLSAASDSEEAADIGSSAISRYPTLDRKPHGAFSNAFLQVLAGKLTADADQNGAIDYGELKVAIARALETGGFGHRPQSLPQSHQDSQHLAQATLFDRQIPIVLPPKTPVFSVHLTAEAKTLAADLATLSPLRLVAEQADLVIARQDTHWLLLNGAGDLIGKVPVAQPVALLQRVHQLLQFHQLAWRGETSNPFRLHLSLVQETRGNTLVKGENLSFHLQLGVPAWLVVLDVNAAGEVIPLYPYFPAETARLPAQKRLFIPSADPSQAIEVTAPLGTDLVVAFAFTQRPNFLNGLLGKDKLTVNSSTYQALLTAVQRSPEQVAVQVLKLRTIPK